MCHTVAMTATERPSPDRRPLAVPAPRARSDWDAWGTVPARLPAAVKAIVATLLPGKAHPVPRRSRPALTASRLDDTDLAALAGTGAQVTRDDGVRILHLGG